ELVVAAGPQVLELDVIDADEQPRLGVARRRFDVHRSRADDAGRREHHALGLQRQLGGLSARPQRDGHLALELLARAGPARPVDLRLGRLVAIVDEDEIVLLARRQVDRRVERRATEAQPYPGAVGGELDRAGIGLAFAQLALELISIALFLVAPRL